MTKQAKINAEIKNIKARISGLPFGSIERLRLCMELRELDDEAVNAFWDLQKAKAITAMAV